MAQFIKASVSKSRFVAGLNEDEWSCMPVLVHAVGIVNLMVCNHRSKEERLMRSRRVSVPLPVCS